MRIAQLSDSHVRAAGKLYKGVVDSNQMLATAVEAVNALRPSVDLVLLTGDVVDDDDGKEDMTAAYDMATSILARLEAPLLAIPGNHDDRQLFRHYFPNPGYHFNRYNKIIIIKVLTTILQTRIDRSTLCAMTAVQSVSLDST